MQDTADIFVQMRGIADLAPIGVGLFDIQTTKPVFMNRVYYELIGYSEEESRGLAANASLETLLLPEDKAIAQESAKAFIAQGRVNGCEYRIVRKDGGVRWIKLNLAKICLQGRDYAFATFSDITAEKELATHLTLIAENVGTSLSLIRITKNGEELVYGNDAFYSNVGTEPEVYRENMRLPDRKLVSEADYQRIREATRLAVYSGKPGEVTHKYFRPDGKVMWLSRHFAAIRQAEPDTYLLVSAVTDVTAVKERELELSISRQRFQTVIEELNAAVFEWNLQTGEFYCSEAYYNYAFSRLSPKQILARKDLLDTVHPEDVPLLQTFLADADSGKPKVETVLREKMTSGAYHRCRLISFFYQDQQAKPLRKVGVIIDVNEDYERSFMLNNTLNELPGGVAMFCYPGKMVCQYYNDGFAKLLGRSRAQIDELLAKGTFLQTLVATPDLPRFMDAVTQCVATGKPLNTTYRYYYSDGGIRWIHLFASKIREENGVPVYYSIFSVPSEEAELYRSIVEDAIVGVLVLDRQNRCILYSNEKGRQYMGAEHESRFVGRAVKETLKARGKRPILTDADVAALQTDAFTEFHAERNGRYLAARARALLWNGVDAYIVYLTDDTSEHDEQLRLQRLIDGVPSGIGIYELDDGVLSLKYLNQTCFRETNWTTEDRKRLFGRQLAEAVHPEDRAKGRQMLDQLSAGSDQAHALLRLQNGNHEWTWFKMTCSVVERKGTHLKLYGSFSNCNEIVLAQQQLEENRIKEQTMLASLPGGVVIYRLKKDQRVVMEYASEGFAKLMRYRDTAEMMADVKGDAVSRLPEKDAKELMTHVLAALEQHRPVSFTYNVYDKDGELVKLRMDARAMQETKLGEDDLALLYAVHTLVSQEAQLALDEQHRYRALMDALNVALVEWDRERGFFASERYTRYAISREPFHAVMHNRASAAVVHPDDLPALNKFFEDCARKPDRVASVLRMTMTDGAYRWTEMLGFIEYDQAGEPERIIGVFRDIDQERIEQNKRLQGALAEAKKASEAKSAFLSRISHDMRTPLNGMLGLTRLMKDSAHDAQQLSDLTQMEISGQYLLNLINDTLDVSRIESGKLELHPTVCDGRKLFENVVALSKPVLEAKRLHAECVTEGLTYPMLYVDIGRVQQIMMNILGNAAKFTPEGGHVTCTMRNLSVADGVIEDEVCIRDDGIGMSQEYLPHIFEAFSQADGSKKNSRQGTGLGMVITKQLVELMGGVIHVESEPGKGTAVTFTLRLPLATDEQIAQWRPTEEQQPDDTFLYGRHVLLCEDHPLNAAIATRMLARMGVQVTHATNGQLGVEYFSDSPPGHFDAILMDIRMPELDGLEATRTIRALPRRDAQTIPIIAMTANAFADDVRQTQHAGMDTHLSKPVLPKVLYETLETCIRTGHTARKPVVLVVDDSALSRAMLCHTLEKDYELLQADSGASALTLLQNHDDISLVITDIQMPELDGLELIRRIRADKQLQSLPIIADTQFGDREQEQRLLEAGADEFIFKPASPELINLRVRHLISHRHINETY